MKIAWAKFGGAITYGTDALLGTAGGVNMNSRYIRDLLALGHDVFPIVPITRKSDPWPGSKEQPISHADLVIVENGPNSLLPSYAGVPAITYLLSKLAEYAGPVVYLQSDPDLPFTFFPENFTPAYYKGPHSAGLQREFKRWYVVTSCRNLPQFIGYCSGRRYQYNAVPHNVSFHVIELHDILADPSIRPLNDVATNHKAAYIGGERRLNKKMVAYSQNLDCDLYGKWKPEKIAELGSHFHYKGIAPDGAVHSTYERYTHSLIIGSPRYESVGMVAARLWETTFAGCLPLLDNALVDPTGGEIPTIAPEFSGNYAEQLLERIGPTGMREMAMNIRAALLARNDKQGSVMQRVLRIAK